MKYSRLDKYEKPGEISQNDQKWVTMYKNVLDKKNKNQVINKDEIKRENSK